MWVTAYTDASFKDGKGTWAVWLKCEMGRVVQSGPCPPWVDVNTAAELYAAYMAVRLAIEEFGSVEGIQINSDCTCTIRALWPWSPKLRRDSMAKVQALVKHACQDGPTIIKIRTKHVKGHQLSQDVRAYLNRQVDKLAGEAHKHAER